MASGAATCALPVVCGMMVAGEQPGSGSDADE
jgi:hypothetical protein